MPQATATTTPIAEAIEAFITECRAKGLSPKTWRDHYGRSLQTILMPWCEQNGLTDPGEITKAQLDRLAISLQGQTTPRGTLIRPSSVKTYLKGINQFLSWWADHTQQFTPRAQLPRVRKTEREVLTRDQIAELEAAAATERDKLVIRIMGDTAAREGEVLNLTVDDLIAKDNRFYFLRVRGKTGERLTAITPDLFQRLRGWVHHGRPVGSGSDRLFLSARRQQGIYRPMSAKAIDLAVQDVVAKTGIKAYPHLFRHSAITWMVTRGMNPAIISEQTGVSLEVILRHYMHLDHKARWDAMMRVHQGEMGGRSLQEMRY